MNLSGLIQDNGNTQLPSSLLCSTLNEINSNYITSTTASLTTLTTSTTTSTITSNAGSLLPLSGNNNNNNKNNNNNNLNMGYNGLGNNNIGYGHSQPQEILQCLTACANASRLSLANLLPSRLDIFFVRFFFFQFSVYFNYYFSI